MAIALANNMDIKKRNRANTLRSVLICDRISQMKFGHNTLVPGGRPCYCGKEGCLDAYCSAQVLASRAEGRLTEFFDRLRAGDPHLGQVWQEYLQYLAVAVDNLHMSFDCDVIVGGYVGAYLEEFGRPPLSARR